MNSANPNKAPPEVDAKEAARLAGLKSDGRIRQLVCIKADSPDKPVGWTESGSPVILLPGRKVGRKWLFLREDVDEWLRRRAAHGLGKSKLKGARAAGRHSHGRTSSEASDDVITARYEAPVEMDGKLRSLTERLRWVESRLDSVETGMQAGDAATQPKNIRPQDARERADAARARAVNLLLEALKEMQMADEERLAEIKTLRERISGTDEDEISGDSA